MSETNENLPEPETTFTPGAGASPEAPQPAEQTSAPAEFTEAPPASVTDAAPVAPEVPVAPEAPEAPAASEAPVASEAMATTEATSTATELEPTAEPAADGEPEPAMMDSYSSDDLDYSSAGASEDDEDDDFPAWDAEPAEPPPPPPPSEDLLDLAVAEIPSFRALRDARSLVFETKSNLDAFMKRVESLGETGEEGRRRGLGAWVLGDYQASTELLSAHGSDPVASFTRAKALMSLRNYKEAKQVYGKLTEEYPDLAPPRAGFLESSLLDSLQTGDDEAAITTLRNALDEAPHEFGDSPEGEYLCARLAELNHDFELALDHYKAAMVADPSLRENLFHGAYLAERCGLDKLAIEFYELLVRQLPIDSNVLMNLGVLYEDYGRDQEAAACYDIVHRSRPTESRVRLYLKDAIAAMDMYYDEDRERKEDRLNQILRIPITDFELSVRARNCLNKMDINVLGDLVRRTEQELLSFKNFGETSLTEIKEILHSKGLRLGMPRDEAVASVEIHTARTYTGEKADIYNKPISHLQLSIRARRTVEALGCLTIGDIVKHSSEELLGMPNFGVTSLQELKSALSQIALKLRGE